MTVIIPPEAIYTELKKHQKILFECNNILPSPFPFILDTLSDRKPVRPNRSTIADIYPDVMEIGEYMIIENNLYLKITTSGIKKNENRDFAVLLGKITDSQKPIDMEKQFQTIQFKNYKLALYEINSSKKENFWMNMSWTKHWEVPRKKS